MRHGPSLANVIAFSGGAQPRPLQLGSPFFSRPFHLDCRQEGRDLSRRSQVVNLLAVPLLGDEQPVLRCQPPVTSPRRAVVADGAGEERAPFRVAFRKLPRQPPRDDTRRLLRRQGSGGVWSGRGRGGERRCRLLPDAPGGRRGVTGCEPLRDLRPVALTGWLLSGSRRAAIAGRQQRTSDRHGSREKPIYHRWASSLSTRSTRWCGAVRPPPSPAARC